MDVVDGAKTLDSSGCGLEEGGAGLSGLSGDIWVLASHFSKEVETIRSLLLVLGFGYYWEIYQNFLVL